MAVKLWRNLQRVSSEALAKEDNGCEAVRLHRARVRASRQRSGVLPSMRRILRQLFCSEVFVSPVAKEEW
jgi:hypothetical protein